MYIAEIPLPAGAKHMDTPVRVVIHSMAEYIDTEPHDYYAVEWLRKLGLSAHAFITPSGVIVRSRKDDEGAYHAKNWNSDSLGVEFLVSGVHTYATFAKAIKKPYLTEPQYEAGVALLNDWLTTGIEVVRHQDLSPYRKIDPGTGFPWDDFLKDIRVA